MPTHWGFSHRPHWTSHKHPFDVWHETFQSIFSSWCLLLYCLRLCHSLIHSGATGPVDRIGRFSPLCLLQQASTVSYSCYSNNAAAASAAVAMLDLIYLLSDTICYGAIPTASHVPGFTHLQSSAAVCSLVHSKRHEQVLVNYRNRSYIAQRQIVRFGW